MNFTHIRNDPDEPRTDLSGLKDNLQWVCAFEKKHGRPLRVLHVGNIANNAYLNSKFLREAGVECDVLCYDYYHVMGCPEWEEAEITSPYGHDFWPKFSKKDLGGFRRPAWFAQGPVLIAMAYLHARVHSHRARACFLWKALEFIRERQPLGFFMKVASVFLGEAAWAPEDLYRRIKRHVGRVFRYVLLAIAAIFYLPLYMASAICLGFLYAADLVSQQIFPQDASKRSSGTKPQNVEIFLWFRKRAHGRVRREIGEFRAWLSRTFGGKELRRQDEDHTAAQRHLEKFERLFPERKGWTSSEQIASFTASRRSWTKIFSDYDIVQCYATDPLWAAIAEAKPYVAFEHGTLRDFTMGRDLIHTLTAHGYRQANHVFVTNGDCLEYAQRLRIENFSAMIHPVDVAMHRQEFGDAIAETRAKYGAEVLLFCPIRHDWKVKGTDVHLRALPAIRALTQKKVVLLLVNWGAEVDQSRALIEELGCSDMVIWLSPLCRVDAVRLMRSADVVLDQMALPHFGATAPQSIAAGTPVISSYDPSSTAWLVDEPAPILPAFSPSEVARAVHQALQEDWRVEYKRRAAEWMDRYHHTDRLIKDHLRVYRSIIEGTDHDD